MGDILSQNEIDALLNALTSGELDVEDVAEPEKEKTIKKYDFARPSKFGKEQLRTLEIIFDNYARMVSSFLTGYLRTATQIEVINAEQVTYHEYSNSLSNPIMLAVLELAPLKGSVILDMASNIGYAIIDRVLGGEGSVLNTNRDFSEIERILLERVIVQLLNFIPEPFENVVEVSPRLDKIETNPQFAQIVSPNEMTALVTLSIKMGNTEGFMNFCIPHLTFEPIMGRLNTKYWFSKHEEEDTSAYKALIEKKLETTKIPIKIIVGRTDITVNDFVHLQAGDIITLDSYVNSDIDIEVGNLLKFRGKPGISKNKNAVQITTVLRKED